MNGEYILSIQVEHVVPKASAWDEFICDLIIDGLAALVEATAPELLEVEVPAEIDLQAECLDALGQLNQIRIVTGGKIGGDSTLGPINKTPPLPA